MTTSLARRIGVAALATALAMTLAACSSQAAASTSNPGASPSSTALPTGTTGAAHFDSGDLQVGTGTTVVDTYIDPMCPFCGEFEKSSGSSLVSLVDAGTITLRIHPLDFLDRSSQGTQYSTRASGALTCVATDDPNAVLKYLASLYAHQPKEDTAGLTDAMLVTLAHDVGVTDADSCITSHRYAGWVSANNDKAISGPIPGANIQSIQGTPTILVNGKVFKGEFTDNGAVMAFVTSGGTS